MTGTNKPDTIVRSLLPVIMAGILSIYGLVISVFILLLLDGSAPISFFASSMHLGAGLTIGLSCLSAGYCIGVVGDQSVRAFTRQNSLFNGMLIIMVFAEMIGMYGFIAAMMLIGKSKESLTC